LWPYAIRMANEVHNFSPSIKEGISPIEKFSQVQVSPRVKHCHTFGCPVYVLDGKLQAGKGVPKWDDRARIGLFLGFSPRHGRKVALVLNLTTGHVSPQFHIVFDDLFDTLRPSSGNAFPKSLWQQKAGFVLDDGTPVLPKKKDKNETTAGKIVGQADIPGKLQTDETYQETNVDESFEQGEEIALPPSDDDEVNNILEPEIAREMARTAPMRST
jgi:hypothetical protein